MPDTFNPSESYEQRRLVAWLRFLGLDNDDFTAIPLGGLRDDRTAAILVHEGVGEGAPDILFYSNPPIGLELKRRKGGRMSEAQNKVHASAARRGWTMLKCDGCEEAKSALLKLPQFLALLPNPSRTHNPTP